MRYAPLFTLLLSACAGGAMPVDARKTLEGMDGPKVPTMQDMLGESAKKAEGQGDFKQAAVYYRQMLGRAPENSGLMLTLAENLRRGGELDKAIALYDRLSERDAVMVDAKEGKVLALIAKGDAAGAGTLLDEVLAAEPDRWKALNAKGIVLSIQGHQDKAQASFQAALKQRPDSVTVLNNLGLSQALARKFAPALASLQQAAKFADPATAQRRRVDLNTALVYAASGKLAQARTLAEQYLSGAELNNNLGLYAHLAKDDTLARSYLNMALTESKVYYDRAWQNLQGLASGGAAPRRNDAPGSMALPVDLFPGE